MRARMVLLYSGIKTVLREVDLSDKPKQMLDVSSKATVPVLVLADGKVIDESLDILYWALRFSDPDVWLSQFDEIQLKLAKSFINENDSEFKKNLDRYKYADRFPQQSMQDARDKGEVFIAKLDQHLQQSNYLLGKKLSFADIAIFPFVRQFAYVDKTWFDSTVYAHLQRWLQTLLEMPLFISIMKKTCVWTEATPEIILGE